MKVFNDPTARNYGRLAGGLYFSIAVFGAFAIGYVPSQIVTGDPAGTMANLVAKRGLYNAGIGADTLVMLIEVMTMTMLFQIFRRTNETLAFAAMLARFAMVAVMGAMLLFQAGLTSLATGDIVANDEIRNALAALMIDTHHAGIWVWQAFFWMHLMLLGTLVLKSGLVPRLFGYGLIVGSFGYIFDSVYAFAFPDADWFGTLRIGFLAIVTLSEVGFALWLAIRGPKEPNPLNPALAAA